MKNVLIAFFISSIPLNSFSEINCSDENGGPLQALEKVIEAAELCPAPTTANFQQLCNDITLRSTVSGDLSEKFAYVFDKRIWELSCADPQNDSPEQAKIKIQKMWNQFKTTFKCNLVGSLVDGHLIKFALYKNFPAFVSTLVEEYDLDVNFVDPADQKNALDFINDEIKKLDPTFNPSNPGTRSLREYKEMLIKLGAKPSR